MFVVSKKTLTEHFAHQSSKALVYRLLKLGQNEVKLDKRNLH